MLKPTVLSFAFVLSTLTAACVATEDAEEIDEVSEAEAAIDVVPVERCPDLLNQQFETIQGCVKNGQLGQKTCYRECDIYRTAVPQPGFPPTWTCRIDDTVCGPNICGPCEVPEWEGPLGPL
jgi:hypothetical protein